MRAGLAVLAAVALMLAPGVAHADQQQQPQSQPQSQPQQQPQSGLGLDITPSQGTYKPGEQVTLTFRVTNHTPAACQVGTVADGEVLIASVTRDGASQPWQNAQVEYADGYQPLLASHLVTVQPGDHVDLAVQALTGRDSAATQPLETVGVLPSGGGVASQWLVQSNGRYVVSARYMTPELAGKPVCAGATNIATAAFTVGAAHKAFAWWWLLVAAAVLVLLLVLYIVARRRRARRAAWAGGAAQAGGMARTAGALALIMVAATAMQAARALPAHADDFAGQLDGCMATYTGPGVQPGLVDKVRQQLKSGDLKIVPTDDVHGNRTEYQWPILATFLGKPPHAIIIHWDPDNHLPDTWDPGAPNNPCYSLYHELIHSQTWRNGTTDDQRTCYLPGFNTGANYEEVAATEWENQFRISKGDGARTRYDYGTPVPTMPVPLVPGSAKDKSATEQVQAAMDQCSPTPVGAPEKPKKDPGQSINDPHLATLDQLHYDFQAVGEFVLAKSRDDFQVQVRQSSFAPGDRTVAVNSAAAVRAGSDVIGFYDVDGDLQVHLGGKVLTAQRGSTKLPGGATLTRRAGHYDYAGDGDDVIWPDGSIVAVDPIGSEGLRVAVTPADSRKSTFSGLLGNFDGKSAGDLVSRDGKTIPDQPGFDDLYKVFGDSWRLSQSESMFEYGPGQSTATFTDRTFPDKPVTVADLPQPARDQAAAMCKAAGVTDSRLLDDCVVDVARTGQPSFAAGYAQDQRDLDSAAGAKAPTGPSGGPTPDKGPKPGAILQDGDVVTGSIDQAGGTVDYGLNLAANQQFELVDVSEGMSATVPDTPSATPMLPGPFQFAVAANGQAKLRISMPNGPGKYSFRYVTLKPRTITIDVGAPALSADLDVPGRVDVYRFTPGSDVTAVQVSSTTACDGGPTYGYADDGPQPSVLSPGQLCFGYAHPVSPGAAEQILVWSDGAKQMQYSISLQRS
ncbi:VWD domain-containing protein [Catenulispora rubra]|uniref:VWD domain-containing protein n=1 Tax=Catenulispora rubra TaxID=280293 RepID=UPI00189208EE|nr:VWD domain-containing protein [Catenulispora rubra]